jgi:predicted MFS family arabinose efflux permease
MADVELTTSPDAAGSARVRFPAMVGTYSLGAFNDNFFKQAAMLLALAVGRSDFQGYLVVAFTLPFILFAAPAGWMADRFSRRTVVIAAKVLELAAVLCGAAGICTGNWALVFAMVAAMGLQSAIFSPALNGTIPQIFPPQRVPRANALVKMGVTVAILSGTAMAGVAIRPRQELGWGVPLGRAVVAAAMVAVAAAGVLLSFGMPRYGAAAPGRRFPWSGPADTLRELWNMRKDALLMIVLIADVFVWFMGQLQILVINEMGRNQFGYGEDATSLLPALEGLGVVVGGLLAARLARRTQWHRLLPGAALALAVFAGLVALVPYVPAAARYPALCAILALAGAAGGMILIPCESFIQVRPPAGRKGAVIAAANCAAFCGILLSGPAANGLNAAFLPTSSFAAVAAASLLLAVWLSVALRGKAGR